MASNLFSCLMFNELEAFNPRDQLAFAFVRDKMKPKLKINMFEVEVFEQIAVEYRHNLKRFTGDSTVRKSKTSKRTFNHLLLNNTCRSSSCNSYLSEMWDDESPG